MRLEHLLSGVCILNENRGSRRGDLLKGTVRKITVLVYSVSEDYDMMIKEKS